MIRATSHIFRFDYLDFLVDMAYVEEVEMTFFQKDNDNMPIVKTLSNGECEVDIELKEIFVVLTPDETLKFVDNKKVTIQLKVKMRDLNGGSFTYGFYIQNIPVYPALSETII